MQAILEGLIWSSKGTWLQCRDTRGVMRWSWCGMLSEGEARRFAGERGIAFFRHAALQTRPENSPRRESVRGARSASVNVGHR